MNQRAIIENLNYYADPRVTARPDHDDDFSVDLVQPDGSTVPQKLPTHWAVCPVCQGQGTHVNPSIDAGGLTSEDMADDPDFAEDYRRGAYDVQCARCEGRTTVREVDEDRCTPEQLAALKREQRERDQAQREYWAERRAGC